MVLRSDRVVIFLSLILVLLSFWYYPKWSKSGTEATISWDVAGYYTYLPAIFIYHDLKYCGFAEEIKIKYHPSPNFLQGIKSESGDHIMKYSAGHAVCLLPAFLTGHTYALISADFEADGFSKPYQLAISIWSLLIAFLGLIFLRKILLKFYSENCVSTSIILIVLGSNYLDYASITGAMTHNYLFTINCLILYVTIQIYEKPERKKFIGLGLLIGLSALTRPTEIIICLIPILWGFDPASRISISKKLEFFYKNRTNIFISIIACLLVGSIQLFYWKHVSGSWLIYSYDNQGFSWLKPHLWEGILSYQSGWLVYSPIMILSLIGFVFLFREDKNIFFVTFIYFIIFTYITFSWDIWWYGGSLGQRAMIQSYPILALPMCSLIVFSFKCKKFWQFTLVLISTLFVYLNFWFTHQAHRGGMLHAGVMTKAYFWKVLGTYEKNYEDLKLLDTDEYPSGIRTQITSVLDTSFVLKSQAIILNNEHQYGPEFIMRIHDVPGNWIRIYVDVICVEKEWNMWQMTQLIAQILNENEEVKSRMIRLQRFIEKGQEREIYLDIKRPEDPHDQISIKLWHADSQSQIRINAMRIEGYQSL